MSEETSPGAAEAGWPPLSMLERRLLGVLVEKAKTTPDAYPLSLNALTTGSNQKSNRDPVMNLAEDDVADALPQMQGKGMVTRITSSRVDRWRHNLYDRWGVGKVELAVLAELLLRGPQTEGELRGRAARMEPIEDLDALRNVLRPLAERKLVVFLGPEGKRGTLITHGFHGPEELEALRAGAVARASESGGETRAAAPASSPLAEKVAGLETSLAETRAEVADLRRQVQELTEEVRRIKPV